VTPGAATAILAWANQVARVAGPAAGPEAPPNVRWTCRAPGASGISPASVSY